MPSKRKPKPIVPMSVDEIATELGVSRSTVERDLNSAYRKLCAEFGELNEEQLEHVFLALSRTPERGKQAKMPLIITEGMPKRCET